MNKKLMATLLSFALLMSMASCADKDKKSKKSKDKDTDTTIETEISETKVEETEETNGDDAIAREHMEAAKDLVDNYMLVLLANNGFDKNELDIGLPFKSEDYLYDTADILEVVMSTCDYEIEAIVLNSDYSSGYANVKFTYINPAVVYEQQDYYYSDDFIDAYRLSHVPASTTIKFPFHSFDEFYIQDDEANENVNEFLRSLMDPYIDFGARTDMASYTDADHMTAYIYGHGIRAGKTTLKDMEEMGLLDDLSITVSSDSLVNPGDYFTINMRHPSDHFEMLFFGNPSTAEESIPVENCVLMVYYYLPDIDNTATDNLDFDPFVVTEDFVIESLGEPTEFVDKGFSFHDVVYAYEASNGYSVIEYEFIEDKLDSICFIFDKNSDMYMPDFES